MNTETGKIKEFTDEHLLKEAMENEPLVPIKEKDITPKQKKTKQVSKHDNKSKLGKIFTTARAKRKWVTKQIKKQNKK